MAHHSIPIFSKVEAMLSNNWLKDNVSDITDLLHKIEKAAEGNIKIRFQNGQYVLRGSLDDINAVHKFLFRKDNYLHLELQFPDQSLLSASGPPSLMPLHTKFEAMYLHHQSSIEESDADYVTSQTGGMSVNLYDLGARQNKNSVSNSSVKSEVTQTSTSIESSNVEMNDKSADMSDTSQSGIDKRDESNSVETNDKSAEMTDSCTDKQDVSNDGKMNDKVADMSDTVADGIDKQNKLSKDDSDQAIDALIGSSAGTDGKAALEVNKGKEDEIVSDERTVDPEIWEYMQEIKSDQLSEVLNPFNASCQSKWDPEEEVYKVHLVIHNPSTKENSQNSIALAFKQFDCLYKEYFASCEVETINTKSTTGNLFTNIRSEFPGILLKPTGENTLLIGPGDDVHKAKKYLLSKSKKTGRMHKSFSASSSRSAMDLSQCGKTTHDREFKSAAFAADDSVSSVEDDRNLKGNSEERLTTPPTEDAAGARAEGSSSTNRDGCGDGATAAEFEHLDSNDRQEKSSSSDSFSILQGSLNSSFDDAGVGQK